MTEIRLLNSYDADYLRDESQMTGSAQTISFPETCGAVAEVVQRMAAAAIPVTIQGSRTGICGGAVPLSGHVMNLSKLNRCLSLRRIKSDYWLTVQAGVRIGDLKRQLERKQFDCVEWDEASQNALRELQAEDTLFWPPEPTEATATVGAVLATNARGICTHLYGDARWHVTQLRVIDGTGQELIVAKGVSLDRKNWSVSTEVPFLISPQHWGLPATAELLDLYLGSEGIYGIIVETTLCLRTKPREVWGLAFFFLNQDGLCRFAGRLVPAMCREGSAAVAAVEYIDRATLAQIMKLRTVSTKLQALPAVDERYSGMLYLEIHGSSEPDLEEIAGRLYELSAECGGDDEFSWALIGEGETEKIREFRHAAQESLNLALAQCRKREPRLLKLAADIAWPDHDLAEILAIYQQDAKENGLEIAIFGHVPDNRLHVNLLPRSYEEYCTGQRLVEQWSTRAIRANGFIFSEYGVGKIKKDLFVKMTEPVVLREMKKLKRVVDPKNVLNFGNRFG
ncbi:MAG TPA: FAD-binding oxidoreductase [Patescibacteria group bacterium]|nr:FAD-binding oxidoreductase [Patescibacteria group bacterium]